jgi:ABC-type nitrate/sulfonate/bicarbonate transport system substrate-binding protein
VRCGELGESACVTFALADPSADIVAAATAEYIGEHPSSIERRAARVAAAIDWIRRALPVNRAAVFATLLALHDEAVDTALRSVRLLLDQRETIAVRLQLADDTAPAVARFLQDWQEISDLQPSS